MASTKAFNELKTKYDEACEKIKKLEDVLQQYGIVEPEESDEETEEFESEI